MQRIEFIRRKSTISVIKDVLGVMAILGMFLPWLIFSLAY